jgi:hypothetical protein
LADLEDLLQLVVRRFEFDFYGTGGFQIVGFKRYRIVRGQQGGEFFAEFGRLFEYIFLTAEKSSAGISFLQLHRFDIRLSF